MYSLGLEFSTQSVKVLVLDVEEGCIVFMRTFNYDGCFPHYGTLGGVLPSDNESKRHTSPLMLVEALDYAFNELKEACVNLSLIKAIKLDAMQHCTVYVNGKFEQTISVLTPHTSLRGQLDSCFSRPSSPIWEDRSTVAEALSLSRVLKDKGGIASLTGNRAELRFPAVQILKWGREMPEEYAATERIFLLSAFITSILTGRVCPVDTGDGWGTNLNNLDIEQPGWNDEVVAEVESLIGSQDNTLKEKIGLMNHYDAPAGFVSPYFTEKYGIPAKAKVLTGTGDNPATLLGCGGVVVISLGSSYTVNGVIDRPIPSASGEYNIFGYTKGRTMALSVITNGGKVHDSFIRKYIMKGQDRTPTPAEWTAYMDTAGRSILSPDEPLLLPYLLEESVPLRKKGMIRAGFTEDNAAVNIRALHVSQALSLKLHSANVSGVDSICLAGSGSQNHFMKQLLSDIFQAEVYSIDDADYAAPLGCAISGARELLGISYEEAVVRFVKRKISSSCRPIKENEETNSIILDRYRELESDNI